LAFWTQGDAARIDNLFRGSALMREKWNRADYRERTIRKAVDGKTEFYTPGPRPVFRLRAPLADRAAGDDGDDQNDSEVGGGAMFPLPIPMSALAPADDNLLWLLDGYLARDAITLLTALWKIGKTTWLTYLLQALQLGGSFCGRAVRAGRTLYVTEESKSVWSKRRDALGLTDATELVVRPFLGKPDWAQWFAFLDYLGRLVSARPVDLIVFDPLANLWPVREENAGGEVSAALMPLRAISEGRSLLLVHHPRKSDGGEGTASRGSGALPAFVDIILEMRRFNPGDSRDCKRVLTGLSRYDSTPAELVVELTADGYVGCGDREAAELDAITQRVLKVLPDTPPGLTAIEILDAWEESHKPRRMRFYEVLSAGVEAGRWRREGAGKKGDPHKLWRPNEEAL
jgi:hypothetical protein